MSEPFRCADARTARGDALAGTATHLRAWLLLEHPGPWGVDALRDARGLGETGAAIEEACERRGIRPLLIRRPDSGGRSGIRAFTAVTRVSGTAMESTTLAAYADALDLDLDALAAGDSPGLTPHPASLYLVCTHGRHDACCAERGRPVAAAALVAAPEQAWECSHVGGDRFAANLLALPAGLYYGEVPAERVAEIVAADRDGRVVLDLLRGRCALPMAAQAGEVALRRALGLAGMTEVSVRQVHRSGPLTDAWFDTPRGRWHVRVSTTTGEPTPLTCRARAAGRPLRHEVLALAPEDPSHGL